MKKNVSINTWSTWATGLTWKLLENVSDIKESEIAEACGWKNARNIQYGNILNRLRDLGEVDLHRQLKMAIKRYNHEA